jgi:hypothetical protein
MILVLRELVLRQKYIFHVALTLLLLHQPGLACPLLNDLYIEHLNKTQEIDSYGAHEIPWVVTATNANLKLLNDKVFLGTSIYSQSLTSTLHLLFVTHFRASVIKSDVLIDSISSKFIKNIELGFLVTNLGKAEILAKINEAREKAVVELMDYIFDRDPQVVDKVANLHTLRPLNKLVNDNLFGISSQYLLKTGEINKISSDLLAYFGTRRRVLESFRANYGIGAGHSILDASFAAKISVARRGHAVLFSFETLKKALFGIENQRIKIAPIFERLTSDERINLFAEIRRNKSQVTASLEWSRELDLILERHFPALKNNAYQKQAFIKKIEKYLRTINFFDFLPKEWMGVDEKSAASFERVRGPNIIMFFDGKNVGAENAEALSRLAHKLMPIVSKVAILKKSMKQDGENQAVSAEISRLFIEINSQRQQVLAETNQSLKSIVRRIKSHLSAAFGNNFGFWHSGDDMYAVVAKKHSGKISEEMLRGIMQDFGAVLAGEQAVRAGAAKLQKMDTISLDQARVLLAAFSDQMKEIDRAEQAFDRSSYFVLRRFLSFGAKEITLDDVVKIR